MAKQSLPEFGWTWFVPPKPPELCRWCGSPLWETGCAVLYCEVCDTTKRCGFYLNS